MLSHRSKDDLSLMFLRTEQKVLISKCRGFRVVPIAKFDDRCFCYFSSAMFVSLRGRDRNMAGTRPGSSVIL